jgi:hypothetical protein
VPALYAVETFLRFTEDPLVAEDNEVRYALGLTEPAGVGVGVKHWVAAIAALIAHRLAEEGFPAPSWTLSPERLLKKKWTVNGGRYVVPVEIATVPPEFLKRGVLVAPATLESV